MKPSILKVLLLIGMPASGKSTWTLEFIRKNPEWMRVGRDHFRFMLRDQGWLDIREEQMVTDLVRITARRCLMMGYHVVIDNTHLSLGHVEQITNDLKDLAEIGYRYFDTPYEVCLERDAKRDRQKQVGVENMKAMKVLHDEFVECFHFQPVKRTGRIVTDYTQTHVKGLPEAIIVDIDGTLAHSNNRRGPFELKKVGLDDPDDTVIALVKAWRASGVKVIVMSGRDEDSRSQTEEWLKAAGVEYDHPVLLRPENHHRRDAVVKRELFEEHIRGKYNVIAAIDDRDQIVELWRSLGIKCLQVEYGDF